MVTDDADNAPDGDNAAAADNAAADASGRQDPHQDPRGDRDARARLRRFVDAHGSEVVAAINHVGRVGVRIVAVAPSGEYGDVLVGSMGAAQRLCADLGIAVRDWDREMTATVTPSRADRVRMGTRQR